ncbi:hypothetical protein Pan216_49380 [Planctomycetes bacterium Pan216]|uniref:Uncharacterized protein n=1 Tax=Kolteria novifilia TaxID=2527975 RepID=A0A518BAP0_9BACT|nr:hypothetical protein Pan216_49380 [Planctomycetes bacterium Pan216]
MDRPRRMGLSPETSNRLRRPRLNQPGVAVRGCLLRALGYTRLLRALGYTRLLRALGYTRLLRALGYTRLLRAFG